jgi:hypothetical protein
MSVSEQVPNAGTSTGPSWTRNGDQVCLAWKGEGSDPLIYYATTTTLAPEAASGEYGFSMQGPVLDLETDAGPALASLDSTVYLVYKAAGEDLLRWATCVDVATWTDCGPLILDPQDSAHKTAESRQPPALVSDGSALYLFWTESATNQICWSSFTNNEWAQAAPVADFSGFPFETTHSPAAAFYGDTLQLAWVGLDSDVIWWASYAGPSKPGEPLSWAGIWESSVALYRWVRGAPTMVSDGERLWMAWTDKGGGLIYSAYNSTTAGWSAQEGRYGVLAEGRPALVSTTGGLGGMMLAWKGDGSDPGIHYGALDAPQATHVFESSSNYIIYGNCEPLRGLEVKIVVSEQLESNIGFCFQLNAYSAAKTATVWQQFFVAIEADGPGSEANVYTYVECFASDGSEVIRASPEIGKLPAAGLSAGSEVTIALETEPNGNVGKATFHVVDPQANPIQPKVIELSKYGGSEYLAPIVAFELDVVGPTTGRETLFSSGSGTITYTAQTTLMAMSVEPDCTATGVGTGETGNSRYGGMTAAPSTKLEQTFTTPLPRQFTPGSGIAAAQQVGANRTNLFAVSRYGEITVFQVEGAGTWGESAALPPSGFFRGQTTLATSPQFGISGQGDVFAVNQNGCPVSYESAGFSSWIGPNVIYDKGIAWGGAGCAAIGRAGVPNQTDLFFVDRNGHVNLVSVDGNSNWSAPKVISSSLAAPPVAKLAACAQAGVSGQTDVFAIGNNGQLNVIRADGSSTWKPAETIGAKNFAPAGAYVAASPQAGVGGQTDVFVVDEEGQLNVFWADGSSKWKGPEPIGTKFFAPAGAPVAVSQRFGVSGRTDVFIVDKDGQLNVFWVLDAGKWKGPEPIGAKNFAPPGSVLAVCQQAGVNGRTDLFVINNEGHPAVFWVEDAGTWSGPATLQI